MAGDASETVAIIGAIAAALVAIIGAVAGLWVETKRTHRLVNSRMDELVALTRSSALAEGKLDAESASVPRPKRSAGES